MTTPVVKQEPDGRWVVRVRIPANLWAIAGETAQELGVDQLKAFEIMLLQIAKTVENNGSSTLGVLFKSGYERLLAKDAMPHDGLPPIDAGRLHRSTRTKSGYVGVYANGQGFRAMARQPGQGRIQASIGTFPTAERAAWARYLFYVKHGLPYGTVEEIVDEQDGLMKTYRDQLRTHFGREPTEAELVSEVNQHHRDAGDPEIEWKGAPLPEPQFKRDFTPPPRRGRVVVPDLTEVERAAAARKQMARVSREARDEPEPVED